MSTLNTSRREFIRLSSLLSSASALGVATPLALKTRRQKTSFVLIIENVIYD